MTRIPLRYRIATALGPAERIAIAAFLIFFIPPAALGFGLLSWTAAFAATVALYAVFAAVHWV